MLPSVEEDARWSREGLKDSVAKPLVDGAKKKGKSLLSDSKRRKLRA